MTAAAYLLWAGASAVAIAGSFVWLSVPSSYGPAGTALATLGALAVFATGIVSMCFASRGMFATAAT